MSTDDFFTADPLIDVWNIPIGIFVYIRIMLSKADRTRQYIVEKTAPVFNRLGYAGTSLNDMITVTGLTKGSIYGNFSNKDEVALAAFDHNFGKVVSLIKTRMEEKKGMIEKLLVYPETYRHFLKIPVLRAGCPLLNTSAEADDTHPLLKAKAADAFAFWKSSVVRLIKKGIEKKQIRESVQAEPFAAILMALVEGAVMQAKVTGKSTDLHTSMDFLEKMIRDMKK